MFAFLRLLDPCACETPDAFLMSMRERMHANGTQATTVVQVNRFWSYRSRCGLWRCSGGPAGISAQEISEYLPLLAEVPVPPSGHTSD